MFDEDDDYYDEEDDEYDGEEGEGGKGPLLLVGGLVLIAVGAVGFAIMLLTGGNGADDNTTASAPGDLEAGNPTADASADTAGLDGGFDFGDMGVLDSGSAEDATPTPAPTTAPTTTRRTAPTARPLTPRPTIQPSRTNDVVIDYSASARRDPDPTPAPADDSGASGSDTGDADIAEATPEAAEPAPEPDPSLSFETDYLGSLADGAGAGTLESNVVTHLQAAPIDHPNYWRAWAAVMKNAEAKKDYRGHCEATEKVMVVTQFKYNPEFNLEMAKCHLRNGRLLDAVDNADRTINNAMDLSSRSKSQRLLLAYKIRAKCRTILYANDAKTAAGLADRNKLSMAIQAWTDYSNYATGTGNTSAQQEADRELADLKAREGR
jgi:hypothetical protein